MFLPKQSLGRVSHLNILLWWGGRGGGEGGDLEIGHLQAVFHASLLALFVAFTISYRSGITQFSK